MATARKKATITRVRTEVIGYFLLALNSTTLKRHIKAFMLPCIKTADQILGESSSPCANLLARKLHVNIHTDRTHINRHNGSVCRIVDIILCDTLFGELIEFTVHTLFSLDRSSEGYIICTSRGPLSVVGYQLNDIITPSTGIPSCSCFLDFP